MNAKKLPNLPPKKTSAFSLDKVCEALTAARGNVTVAARSLGYTRAWMHMLIAKHPELKAAKANLVGGFPLRIDNNRKILDNMAVIGFHQLPLDYLDTWTARVEKVTVADIRAAFARKLSMDSLVTVVVGGEK